MLLKIHKMQFKMINYTFSAISHGKFQSVHVLIEKWNTVPDALCVTCSNILDKQIISINFPFTSPQRNSVAGDFPMQNVLAH